MSELYSDHSLWPLCILSLKGEQSLEQHRDMMAIWDSWFSHGEEFIALRVYRDSASLKQAAGIAQATKHWLQSGAAKQIQNQVSAMLMVIPDADFELSNRASVKSVFGVDGGIFPDLASATDWLQEQKLLPQETLRQAEQTIARMSPS